jgi:hypothetical protein
MLQFVIGGILSLSTTTIHTPLIDYRTYPNGKLKMNLRQLKRPISYSLYYAFLLLTIIFGIGMLNNAMGESDWHDFDVFLTSAKAALNGRSIYIISGKFDLPFWYLPWTAWFYIPFAIWPRAISLVIYIGLSILSVLFVVNSLAHYYNPRFKFLDMVLVLSLIVPMSNLNIIVGQMDYILLGLVVLTMYAIEEKKDVLAGILFPLLWIKPHLFIVFTLFAFWRAGKRTIAVSVGLSAAMLLVESFLQPTWVFDMLELLQEGTQRTKSVGFTTFPNLLGSQENWVGTANLPFTIILVILAILIVWRFRSLPTIPLLSLSLAASLFCAPRAHAYDLVFLIPAMLWLTTENFKSTFWLWIIAAIIPILASYSTNSYLVTLFVFLWTIRKAYVTLKLTSILNTSTPKPLDA